jgi:hypothetical protein
MCKVPRELIVIDQTTESHFIWRLCGVLVLTALIIASLFLPTGLEQLRSGHWEVEHFLAYFVAVLIICLGWPRPLLVAAGLIPLAALLEALQCLNPVHSPNFFAAISSIAGVVTGTVLATLIIRLRNRQSASKDRRKVESAG